MASKPNNSQAMALQEKSLAEQQRMNAFQMKFMERQQKALEAQQPEPYRPQPAIPTAAKAGADDSRIDLRARMSRRFGLAKTVVGGAYA